jgi:hypothetical protein
MNPYTIIPDSTPYRRNLPTYDSMTNIPVIGKSYAHDTPANYSRSASIDQSETLFFGSAIKVVNGVANFTFKMSDLQTTFRIQANYYGQQGVAFSQRRI